MRGSGLVPEPLAELPWRVILLVLAIGCFGLVVLYSAAGGNLRPWAFSQGIRFFAFVFAAIVASRIPESWWKMGAFPVYALLLVALVGVEALGISPAGRNAGSSWG